MHHRRSEALVGVNPRNRELRLCFFFFAYETAVDGSPKACCVLGAVCGCAAVQIAEGDVASFQTWHLCLFVACFGGTENGQESGTDGGAAGPRRDVAALDTRR